MFHRKVDQPFAEELANLRSAFALPPKPAALQLAATALRRARIDRANIEGEMRSAVLGHHTASLNGDTPPASTKKEIERLTSELAAATDEVSAHRAALAKAKADFGPKLLAAVAVPGAATKVLAHELVDLLQDALDPAVEVYDAVILNGSSVPRFLTNFAAARNHVFAIRALLNDC